ncbi:MAG: hypothetical protein JWR52_2974 [Marmoricola sp.]|nr:hypothetical protein [Marmoricola sp.]
MARRPILRVAALGVIAAIAGFLVIGAYLGVPALRYHHEESLAKEFAYGTVIQDNIGDAGDIRVRWQDQTGRPHVQRFAIYDTGRYVKGASFAVRYNASNPGGAVYPGDPDETSAFDDYWVPIMFAGLGALGVLTAWAVRGIRFRLARRRPSSMASAKIHGGEARSPGVISFGRSAWLEIQAAYEAGSEPRWQRVMWHPMFDDAGPRVAGTVHGDLESRRPVVFETDDHICLVPIGRLRKKVPKRVALTAVHATRISLADTFIVPVVPTVASVHAWWRGGLMSAGAGAMFGSVVGLVVVGPVAVVPFAAAASAGATNFWTLRGAEQ